MQAARLGTYSLTKHIVALRPVYHMRASNSIDDVRSESWLFYKRAVGPTAGFWIISSAFNEIEFCMDLASLRFVANQKKYNVGIMEWDLH